LLQSTLWTINFLIGQVGFQGIVKRLSSLKLRPKLERLDLTSYTGARECAEIYNKNIDLHKLGITGLRCCGGSQVARSTTHGKVDHLICLYDRFTKRCNLHFIQFAYLGKLRGITYLQAVAGASVFQISIHLSTRPSKAPLFYLVNGHTPPLYHSPLLPSSSASSDTSYS
jgi:hypothetical protein